MTNAEQWLSDLEAKAKAYKSSSTYERLIAKDEYFAAANPATVLRLVGMVRWLADNLQRRTCPDQTLSCEMGCQICVLSAAYNATEANHDQP